MRCVGELLGLHQAAAPAAAASVWQNGEQQARLVELQAAEQAQRTAREEAELERQRVAVCPPPLRRVCAPLYLASWHSYTPQAAARALLLHRIESGVWATAGGKGASSSPQPCLSVRILLS